MLHTGVRLRDNPVAVVALDVVFNISSEMNDIVLDGTKDVQGIVWIPGWG